MYYSNIYIYIYIYICSRYICTAAVADVCVIGLSGNLRLLRLSFYFPDITHNFDFKEIVAIGSVTKSTSVC